MIKNIFKKNNNILILGAGASGKAAGKFLDTLGSNTFYYDDNNNINNNLKNSNFKLTNNINALILSPGIPRSHKLVTQALNLKIPIYSEIDLAYQFLPPAKFIGITGTNGKSTTTKMVEHVLRLAGHSAIACGNFGTPLCDFLLNKNFFDFYVLELSSYQLETISSIKLDAAIILNISPDHLDRYQNLENYLTAKLNIINLLLPTKKLLANNSISKFLPNNKKAINYYSPKDFSFLGIRGIHNYENATAAAEIAKQFGIEQILINKAIESFTSLPHRCEVLGTHRGITFINDSKATNVNAVNMALSMLTGPSHLLLGGFDKGEDYSLLNLSSFNHPINIYTHGQASIKIASQIKDFSPKIFNDLEESFWACIKNAAPGDFVILSPACASFDQYKNYEERGEHFRKLFKSFLTLG